MESIQKKFQIVVSRYNENILWLKNFKEINRKNHPNKVFLNIDAGVTSI